MRKIEINKKDLQDIANLTIVLVEYKCMNKNFFLHFGKITSAGLRMQVW